MIAGVIAPGHAVGALIHHSCRIQPPLCTEHEDCGSWAATPFFLTYLLLNSFIMINMCVAVVLNNFSWIYATEKVATEGIQAAVDTDAYVRVSASELRRARTIWNTFDSRGTGYIVMADIGVPAPCFVSALTAWGLRITYTS